MDDRAKKRRPKASWQGSAPTAGGGEAVGASAVEAAVFGYLISAVLLSLPPLLSLQAISSWSPLAAPENLNEM